MHDLLRERTRCFRARLLENHGGISPRSWEALLDRVEAELEDEGGGDAGERGLQYEAERATGVPARLLLLGLTGGLVAASVGVLLTRGWTLVVLVFACVVTLVGVVMLLRRRSTPHRPDSDTEPIAGNMRLAGHS
ncbi:hypothetical protein I5Q34_13690 [Streptomyces sp. AV19]|uniref:hypothetical protein n=1 Tax=Streptomyces sp. AV19 TaxID=2793068 RepID=UPI0018FE06E3|nr:hypothetical protein [Streptomyces sp. AV19]MBH1935312.1 hypothetical protein [Streptomyces sp. AV19]MDG4531197.1 hypothetical protein [Streptomyces sp. AV19]